MMKFFSQEDVDVLCVVHESKKLGNSKLGSAMQPSNDGLNSSLNQHYENSMSEENLDITSNISTGESVTAHTVINVILTLLGG
jgi:hypothetical protein